ncbi:MAG: 16S rRNA (cytosine(967)-C(5))-methyltransferase RsmB [Clostridia bacterium]|nr:16S rRNA (cytosine(967)-C(5))-methyltransferase RsmB [Clostridia bacterium]MDD4048492.1 16S rRNA (cytosine(967)-C(5))-methyltransferase RsmB [Clostridia bacterium]
MNAREIAYKILLKIEEGAYANLILDETLRNNRGLTALDRGFITEIVYGTVKFRLRLDWMIEKTVKKPDKLKDRPRVLLRLSFYQLLFMDRVPPSAVTNESVKLAKKFFYPGVASLINGVLRNYLREPEKIALPLIENDSLKYLEVIYSHPRWMLKRWLARYGLKNTEKLCEFNNTQAELWIRTNTLRCSSDELEERLIKEGCKVARSTRVPEGILLKSALPIYLLKSFQEGYFTVQDESSMLVSHVVNPQPEMKVLDVCAAPGGKTTHLAQLMKNKGKIIACDIHQHRLGLIKENANRLGINNIETRLLDATSVEKEVDCLFDLVLVDAPCSGLGVLRRRPDSRWRKSCNDIEQLAVLQGRILESVYHVLAPGAKLIYSTCTLEPEENFDVIDKFKKEHADMVSFDLTTYFPYTFRSEEEKEELQNGMRQYLPFEDEMEGFFIAGLTKK